MGALVLHHRTVNKHLICLITVLNYMTIKCWCCVCSGVRTEQDLYVRLIDSMTKQVNCWLLIIVIVHIPRLWDIKGLMILVLILLVQPHWWTSDVNQPSDHMTHSFQLTDQWERGRFQNKSVSLLQSELSDSVSGRLLSDTSNISWQLVVFSGQTDFSSSSSPPPRLLLSYSSVYFISWICLSALWYCLNPSWADLSSDVIGANNRLCPETHRVFLRPVFRR